MKNIGILLLLTFTLASCGGVNENSTKNQSNSGTIQETKEVSSQVSQDATVVAVMETSLGDITLELYGNKVPKTVTNFIVHAQNNYYDDVTFHRIINGFMIQGGDPLGTGMGGESIYGPKFDDEFDATLSNVPGTISMANSGPNTNGSQFFINQGNNTNLDFNKPDFRSKHAVFGKVIEGMDIVEKIALVPTNPGTGLPNDNVVIKDIKLFTPLEGELKSYIISDLEQAKQDAINKNKEISEQKNSKSAETGDTVGVKYRLTDMEGNQLDGNIDSSEAFEFSVDQEGIIPGFSNALKGMKVGDKKTVTLTQSEGYGEYDETKTQTVPKDLLKTFIDAGIKLEKGNTLPTERGNFIIKDVTDTDVIIDINHSLAGKELNFEIELKYFVN